MEAVCPRELLVTPRLCPNRGSALIEPDSDRWVKAAGVHAANNTLVLTKWNALEMKRRKRSVDKSPVLQRLDPAQTQTEKDSLTCHFLFPLFNTVLPVTTVFQTNIHHWERFYGGTGSLQSFTLSFIIIKQCFIDFWGVGFCFPLTPLRFQIKMDQGPVRASGP